MAETNGRGGPAAYPARGVNISLWPFRLIWRAVLRPLEPTGERRRIHLYAVTLIGSRLGLALVTWGNDRGR